MAFQTALSGLTISSAFLNVIGNNVANSNTVGFKSSAAIFSDMFSSNLNGSSIQVGMGANTATVAQHFNQGSSTATNNPLDMMIAGKGFFGVMTGVGADPSNPQTSAQMAYTRNGQFQINRDGYVVNSGGYLQGYGVDDNGNVLSGATKAIQITSNQTMIPARATGASTQNNAGLNMALNLPADAPVISQGTKNVYINSLVLDRNSPPPAPPAAAYQMRVSDPLGNFHTLYVGLQPNATDTNGWDVFTSIDDPNLPTTPNDSLKFNAPPSPASTSPTSVTSATEAQKISFKIAPISQAYDNTTFNFNLNFPAAQQIIPGGSGSANTGSISGDDNSALHTSVSIYGNTLSTTNQSFNGSFLDPNGQVHNLTVNLTYTPPTQSGPGTWSGDYSVIDPATGNVELGPTTIPAFLAGNKSPLSLVALPTINGGTVDTTLDLDVNGLSNMATGQQTATMLVRNNPPVTLTDAKTFTKSNPETVYDSQGNAQLLTLYYIKVGTNTWEVQTSLNGKPPVTQPGFITFGADGKMTKVGVNSVPVPGTNNASTNPSFYFTAPSPADGASTLSFNVNLSGTIQYGSQFAVLNENQDGFAAGTITGVSVGSDGTIQGNYSNGQTRNVGQIVLYSFVNEQGLASIGNNLWTATYASNAAIGPGIAGTATLGTIKSNAIEASNVDVTQELVAMITAQRSYQANAETIKTEDQLLQTITNLR
ncbi:flagellar hook-basal body complex protein [Burkholderiaceae bacterium DAT-1]|nr:flagellar hook-basal body complex protein [Burkholderiaceae bacterium DAT-1]